jgi:XTP/dITP diphosphohydrolase
MTYVIAATGNAHKVAELGSLFREFGIDVISKKDAEVIVPEPEETGKTFGENALIKARAVFEFCGKTTVADDSGLEVDALGGAPGIFSARFSEKHGKTRVSSESVDTSNNRLLLDLLKDVPPKKRTARFVCAIALLHENGETIEVKGICEGCIAESPSGNGGFGYDPLFIPNEYAAEGRTFAQLSETEKNEISHRGRALAELRKRLTL